MNAQASSGFFGRWHAENIETEIVPGDPGQQPRLKAFAILRVEIRIVLRGIDRLPRRIPEWADPGFFQFRSRDVASAR